MPMACCSGCTASSAWITCMPAVRRVVGSFGCGPVCAVAETARAASTTPSSADPARRAAGVARGANGREGRPVLMYVMGGRKRNPYIITSP